MADDSFQKDLQKGLPTACSISRILPMLEPWYDPGYVKRAWCRFELYTAIWMYREVEVDIILSPKAANAFPDAVVAAIGDMRYTVVDGALKRICTEDASASVLADLAAIRKLIRGYPGGSRH